MKNPNECFFRAIRVSEIKFEEQEKIVMSLNSRICDAFFMSFYFRVLLANRHRCRKGHD